MQHRGNVVLGLRMDASNESSSDSDVFGSEDLDSGPLQIKRITPAPVKIETTPGVIKNFNDIYPHITSLLANLETYQIPKVFYKDIYFIPENIVPDDLSRALLDFSRSQTETEKQEFANQIINFESKSLPNSILAQIDLIHFLLTGNTDKLSQYLDKKLDSRILSLVHFALIHQKGATSSERQEDLYHEVMALEEYIKFPTPAPLSSLFPHFTIELLIYRLCSDLVTEFPSNPFLESVLTNMQPYCSDVENLLPMVDNSFLPPKIPIPFTSFNPKIKNFNRTLPLPKFYQHGKRHSIDDLNKGSQPNQRLKTNSSTTHIALDPDNLAFDSTTDSKSSKPNENENESSKTHSVENDSDDVFSDSPETFPSLIQNNDIIPPTEISDFDSEDNEFDESDSLSNDSFFVHLQEAKQQGATPALIDLQDQPQVEVNVLDLQSTTNNRYEPITLSEPPQMPVFLLQDNSDQMSPPMFENWILSIRCDRPDSIKISINNQNLAKKEGHDDDNASRQIASTHKSNPILAATLSQSDDIAVEDQNVEYFISLLENLDDTTFLKHKLPSIVNPNFYLLYLPILHTLNAINEHPENRGVMYPKILANEREAHTGLRIDDRKRCERSLSYFKSLVNPDSFIFDQVDPKKLDFNQKRPQPPLTPDIPPLIVPLMAVVNYEFIIHSRSPLTLQYYTVSIEDREMNSIVCNSHWRASFLYWQYTTIDLSPYMVFRVALALAVNLADRKPDLSCSFAFEALYTLLSNVPYVRKLPCIRSALLFFGELLDQLNRYYYAADVLDNFFLTDIRNASYSSKIARIAAKNKDVIRSVFHYNQTLKNFVAHSSVDEALYIGQIISSTYIENGFLYLAMSLLTFLLHHSYEIPVGKKREKMEVVALGSLRIPRSKVTRVTASFGEFKPDRKNVSTILAAATLSILFCKLRYFHHANNIIEKVLNDVNFSMRKLILYIKAYIAMRENDIDKMIEVAPALEAPKYIFNIPPELPKLRNANNSYTQSDNSLIIDSKPRPAKHKTVNIAFQASPIMSSRFNMLSASNFDPNMATLRLFARAFLDRDQFKQALLYSELFLHCCSPQNTKEIGVGFYLRGLALKAALKYCPTETTLFESSMRGSPLIFQNNTSSPKLYLTAPTSQSSFASSSSIASRDKKEKEKKEREKNKDPKLNQHDKLRFPQLPFDINFDSNKLYTRQEIQTLAYISFATARFCFKKVALSGKVANTSLFLLELAIDNPEIVKYSMQTFDDFEDENRQETLLASAPLQKQSTNSFSIDDPSTSDDNIQICNSENTKNHVYLRIKKATLLTNFENFDPPEFSQYVDPTLLLLLPLTDKEDLLNESNNESFKQAINDKIDYLVSSVQKQTARILDPISVIHYQILASAWNLKKDKVKEAQMLFDYAFNNFQRMFTCGIRLIPSDLTVKRLRYMSMILEQMCALLLEFESSFINERLLAFDIYNDVSNVLNTRLRNIEKRNKRSIDPSIDLSPFILELENPKFPNFTSILQSNGFIPENPPVFLETTTITEGLQLITSNIKLFNKERLSLEEMQNRNRKIINSIQKVVKRIAMQNASHIPPETSFSFLLNCKPEVSGAVYVQRLLHNIFIYIPFIGFKRKLSLIQIQDKTTSTFNGSCFEVDDNQNELNVAMAPKTHYNFSFNSKESLFDTQFLEFCSSLLLFSETKKIKKASTINIPALINARNALFGNESIIDKIQNHSQLQQQTEPTVTEDPTVKRQKTKTVDKKKMQSKDIFSLFDDTNYDSPNSPQLIFIPSVDLEFIPFEFLFPQSIVLRCPFLTQLMLPSANAFVTTISKPILCRYCRASTNSNSNSKSINLNMFDQLEMDYNRNSNEEFDLIAPILPQPTLGLEIVIELIGKMLTISGGGETIINYVDGIERFAVFPSPVLNSYKEADIKKLGFCDFIDVSPYELPKSQNASCGLFIFSYTDLCEMPLILSKIMSDYPFSFFMFIPIIVMKEALKEMKLIFEKKNRRQTLDHDKTKTQEVGSSPMQFVLDLQIALRNKLKLPIPLISYLH